MGRRPVDHAIVKNQRLARPAFPVAAGLFLAGLARSRRKYAALLRPTPEPAKPD
jgi:hypothetical protein